MEQEQQTQTTSANPAGEKAKAADHKHWPVILFAVIVTALVAAGGTYFALMQKMVKDRAAVAISVRSEAQNEIIKAKSEAEDLQNKIDEMKKDESEKESADREKKHHYKSSDLGIEFDYHGGTPNESGNKIEMLPGVGVITVLNKSANETLESAIKKLIVTDGKNSDDCKIILYDLNDGSQSARIVLAQPYEPTQEELDKFGAKGVYSNLIKAIAIENKTNEMCSSFASTEVGPRDYFIYQPNNSKTKFIFVTMKGAYDPMDIDTKSIRIIGNDE